MKRILFLGILILFLISGNAAAMGPAIGVIMKGAGMMGGQKNNDKAENETKHMHVEKDNNGARSEDMKQTHGSSITQKDDESADKHIEEKFK